jgi:hypothetical protein
VVAYRGRRLVSWIAGNCDAMITTVVKRFAVSALIILAVYFLSPSSNLVRADNNIGRLDNNNSIVYHFNNNYPVVSFSVGVPDGAGEYSPLENSEFWRSVESLDDQGIPFFLSGDGKKFYNISTVAFAAMESVSSYPNLNIKELVNRKKELSKKQKSAFSFLENNYIKLSNSSKTWHYNFELNYNNILVRPGWPSAFAQASVIHAYIVAYEITGGVEYLDRAHEAARAYLLSPEEGGLTSSLLGYPFFEEVPLPHGYSPHILNGHLYSLVMLEELLKRRRDSELAGLVERAHAVTSKTVQLFDQGYWTRYDLRPRFVDVPLSLSATAADTEVRSLSIVAPDGTTRRIRTAAAGKLGPRDVAYGPGWSARGEAIVITGQGALLQLMLPLSASVSDLGDYKIVMELSADSEAPSLSVLGFRQRLKEYYPIGLSSSTRYSDRLIAEYRLENKDLQWSDLQRYYVEWHQRLLRALSLYKNDPVYRVTAYRWQNYIDRHAVALSEQLRRLGEAVVKGDGRVDPAAKDTLASASPVLNRRVAVITDDPAIDAGILRAFGNATLEDKAPLAAAERLIVAALAERAHGAGTKDVLELASRIRRLGVAARVIVLEQAVDQRVFLELDASGVVASYDPVAGVAFELRSRPVDLRTALVSTVAGRPAVPAVAGSVPSEPDQITIRSLRENAEVYKLPDLGLQSRFQEVSEPALYGLPSRETEVVDSSQARIVSSTPFYDGHGPDLALAPIAGSYAAAREGEKLNAFTFDMPISVRPNALTIRWNSASTYPRRMKLFGISGDREDVVLNVNDFAADADISKFALNVAARYSRFRFEAEDFVGQDRLIMIEFKLHGVARKG